MKTSHGRSVVWEVGRAIVRQKLLWTERERTRALEQTFDELKKYTIKTEHGRLQTTHLLYKMGLYLLIATRDVQAAKRDALRQDKFCLRRDQRLRAAHLGLLMPLNH